MKRVRILSLLLVISAVALFGLRQSRSPDVVQVRIPGGVFVGEMPVLGEVVLSFWVQDEEISGSVHQNRTADRLLLEGRPPGSSAFELVIRADLEDAEPSFRLQLAPNVKSASVNGTFLVVGEEQEHPVKLTRIADYAFVRAKTGLRVFGRGLTREYRGYVPVFLSGDASAAGVSDQLLARMQGLAAGFACTDLKEVWFAARYGYWNRFESWDNLEVAGVGEGWMSLRRLSYEYTGGAHGNWGIEGLNYDFRDGKARLLELPQLFEENTAWVARFSDYCLASLREQGASGVLDGTVNSFGREDLSSFMIHPSGLKIIFNPYTVGSYAEGARSVVVPWEKVADLRTGFPNIP